MAKVPVEQVEERGSAEEEEGGEPQGDHGGTVPTAPTGENFGPGSHSGGYDGGDPHIDTRAIANFPLTGEFWTREPKHGQA